MRTRVIALIAVITTQGLFLTPMMAQRFEKPQFIEGGELIVAPVAGCNDFQVYSKQTSQWSKFTFPDDVRVVPVVGESTCAFSQEGDAILELVAVDQKGNWKTQPLPIPVKKCEPIIDEHISVFVVDGRAYAFSGETGTWDSIEAPAVPALSKRMALMLGDGWIGVFSSKTGKWARAVTRVAKTNP